MSYIDMCTKEQLQIRTKKKRGYTDAIATAVETDGVLSLKKKPKLAPGDSFLESSSNNQQNCHITEEQILQVTHYFLLLTFLDQASSTTTTATAGENKNQSAAVLLEEQQSFKIEFWQFLTDFLRICKFEFPTVVMAVMYASRLRILLPGAFLKLPLLKLSFLTCLVMANKINQDLQECADQMGAVASYSHGNPSYYAFSRLGDEFSLSAMNLQERQFLKALDYSVWIRPESYGRFLIHWNLLHFQLKQISGLQAAAAEKIPVILKNKI